MRDLFAEIKEKISLLDYISRFISVKNRGGRYMALCPFHPEKSPSFHIDTAKNLFYCFGCNAGGDIFEFYTRFHNATKKEALEKLSALCGLEVDRKVAQNPLNKLNDFFKKNLAQNQDAIKFLQARGVNDNSIKKFELGWSANYREILKFLSDEKLDLTSWNFKEAFWRMFENRVVFPVYKDGLVSFGGRVLQDAPDVAKYINGPASKHFEKTHVLYGANFAKKYQPLYIVEGYLDVILLAQHDRCAVSAMGTAFGEHHMQLAIGLSDNLIIAMDGDLAGRKSTLKIAELALEFLAIGKDVQIIEMPQNQDPASFLQQGEDWQNLKPLTLHEYLFKQYMLGADSINKATMAYKKLEDLAKKIPDRILRAEYGKRWKDLWWGRNKKTKQIHTVPEISQDSLILLLFRYIVLYPEIIDEVAEQFVKLPIKDKFGGYVKQLLNREPLDNDFLKRVQSVGIQEDIHSKEDALNCWFKIANQVILKDGAGADQKNDFADNFCDAEWERFKKWIANQEEEF